MPEGVSRSAVAGGSAEERRSSSSSPSPSASASASSAATAVVSVPSAPALLAVRVRGSVCVSQIRLADRSIRLGKTGYVTGWRDVPFNFLLLNQSPIATTCRVTRLPELLEIPSAETNETDGTLCIALQPFETRHVSAVLRASMLEAPQLRQQRSWHIEMANVRNPSNALRLLVTAEVTVLRLRYSGLRWLGHANTREDPRNSAGLRRQEGGGGGAGGGAAGGGAQVRR